MNVSVFYRKPEPPGRDIVDLIQVARFFLPGYTPSSACLVLDCGGLVTPNISRSLRRGFNFLGVLLLAAACAIAQSSRPHPPQPVNAQQANPEGLPMPAQSVGPIQPGA